VATVAALVSVLLVLIASKCSRRATNSELLLNDTSQSAIVILDAAVFSVSTNCKGIVCRGVDARVN
jgi:hypothetical protein